MQRYRKEITFRLSYKSAVAAAARYFTGGNAVSVIGVIKSLRFYIRVHTVPTAMKRKCQTDILKLNLMSTGKTCGNVKFTMDVRRTTSPAFMKSLKFICKNRHTAVENKH